MHLSNTAAVIAAAFAQKKHINFPRHLHSKVYHFEWFAVLENYSESLFAVLSLFQLVSCSTFLAEMKLGQIRWLLKNA